MDIRQLSGLASLYSRRSILRAGSLTVASITFAGNTGSALRAAEADAATPDAAGLSPPEHNPDSEHVFSIVATIDEALTVGSTATGEVRAIPITGGTVQGEGINGRVLPGGADWQRTREDGVTEIEATYAIELDGDTLVKVVNRGIIVPPASSGEDPYFRTHVSFVAPAGDYAWLNEAIFLCTAGLHPEFDGAVLVDVFRLI